LPIHFGEPFFEMSVRQFTNAISSNRLEWTAYYDEAFDHSSYVLQFEDDNQVRLVAFTGTPDFLYDSASLRDISLSLNEFYGILQEWHDRFKEEWRSLPKVPSSVQWRNLYEKREVPKRFSAEGSRSA
jgi:hypothetical protein